MRLTKITTRTGDDGSTGLADGARLAKHHPRITVIGSIDELNCHLGVLLAEDIPQDIRDIILKIQNDLFEIGGALAQPTKDRFGEKMVLWLDEKITLNNTKLPFLREFILPGGLRAGALCQLARAVARRAERELVVLMQTEDIPQYALMYLNRLSDLLFVLARCINLAEGVAEICWLPEK